MSRVFAVHQPTGRDPASNAIRPTMDLSPATEFGELRFVLREWENPFDNIKATVEEVYRVLDGEKFDERDWLLLVGNPVLIGIVAAAAALSTGGTVRFLQWNRAEHRYLPVIAQL